jgi:putative peptidoglycan lipid II flippase
MAAYVTFGALAVRRENSLSTLTRRHELILSVGTTLGVAALLLTLLVPLWRSGIRLRPTLHFPPGVASTIRAMAISGAVVVGSQDLATAVVLRLANASGSDGSVVLYNLAWTVFTVPWAVAAVPLATSTFPGLTAAWQRGDRAAYQASTARTVRVMLAVTAGAAAVMGAAAGPLARVVVLGAPGGVAPTVLARGLATFAPGLVGYGLIALLQRSLYAQNNARTPASAVLGGWAVAIVADVVLVAVLPASWTVAAFGIGTSIGVSVSGAWLLVSLARSAGRESLTGFRHAAVAAFVGGVIAAAAGTLVARVVPTAGVLGELAIAVAVGAIALVVHTAVVAVLDRPTLNVLLNRGLLRRA